MTPNSSLFHHSFKKNTNVSAVYMNRLVKPTFPLLHGHCGTYKQTTKDVTFQFHYNEEERKLELNFSNQTL